MLITSPNKCIADLDFSELVGLVNEPNTPSGAHESIRQICVNLPLSRIKRILDVGSNTGFATIEFASLTDAEVVGVDMNPNSVNYARTAADFHGLTNARFQVGNILELPFEDGSFDMVYCNNVTSFIDDRSSAIDQYRRVLKSGGFMAVVPIYYRHTPPEHMAHAVSQAIGAKIDIRGVVQWEQAFDGPDMQLYYRADFAYDELTEENILSYVDRVISVCRTPNLTEEDRRSVRERLVYFYSLFNENLQYCGFSVLIYRFSPANDFPVLYTSYPV